MGESQPLPLGYPLLEPCYTAYLAAKPHLSGKGRIWREGNIKVRRQHSCHHGQIDTRIYYPHPPRNIQKYILGGQLKPRTFLQHGKQHVQPPDVKARSRTLRGAVGRAAHQGLHLHQHRPSTIYGRSHRHTAQS